MLFLTTDTITTATTSTNKQSTTCNRNKQQQHYQATTAAVDTDMWPATNFATSSETSFRRLLTFKRDAFIHCVRWLCNAPHHSAPLCGSAVCVCATIIAKNGNDLEHWMSPRRVPFATQIQANVYDNKIKRRKYKMTIQKIKNQSQNNDATSKFNKA